MKEKTFYRIFANGVLSVFSLLVLIPVMILVMSSFSDESAAIKYGYSLWPKQFSLGAYQYILQRIDVLGRAYLITIMVTVIGTVFSLMITCALAYGLSQDIPGKKLLMFLVVFTMLFNGGLIPTYYFYTNVFHIKNTYFAYIVPNLLCSAFNIILLKNYYSNSISPALRESARMDGAGEITVFLKIIVPLSMPIMATVGLLNAINYWNDWQNGLYYMDDGKMASIQQVLRNMTNNVSFLASNSGISQSGRQVPGVTVRMAVAVLSVVPVIAVFPFFERYFVKGITLGAVKE